MPTDIGVYISSLSWSYSVFSSLSVIQCRDQDFLLLIIIHLLKNIWQTKTNNSWGKTVEFPWILILSAGLQPVCVLIPYVTVFLHWGAICWNFGSEVWSSSSHWSSAVNCSRAIQWCMVVWQASAFTVKGKCLKNRIFFFIFKVTLIWFPDQLFIC